MHCTTDMRCSTFPQQDLVRFLVEYVRLTIRGENSDRKLLFTSMAKKTGGSTKEVASKFSKAVVKKSKKGHWFRKSSGKWIQ